MASSQNKIIQDTEKRMQELFERLNQEKLGKAILAQLIQLAMALNAMDMNTASLLSIHLMTSSFDQQGKWVLGMKRLVELYTKCLAGQ